MISSKIIRQTDGELNCRLENNSRNGWTDAKLNQGDHIFEKLNSLSFP